MSHSNKSIQIIAKSFLLSLGLTLVACGGGGSSTPAAVVGYTGNTSQATIDLAQAEDISNAFFSSNQKNVGGVVAVANIRSTQTLDSNSKNTLIEKLKQDALASININSSLVSGATSSATVNGNCAANGITSVGDGSSATATTSFSNSEINSTITYNNLCIYEAATGAYLVLNGIIDASIIGTNLLSQSNPTTAVINQIIFSAQNLSVKYTDASDNTFTVTMTEKYIFSLTYNQDGSLATIDITRYTDFDFNGKVYRFEVEITNNITKLKFYHPTYGWVEYVSTLTNGCGDGSADGGTLVITGVNASYTVTPSGSCDGTYTVVKN